MMNFQRYFNSRFRSRQKSKVSSGRMPLYRRSNVYRLRDHEIDPLITYDGIKTNPLPYSDCDTLADDDNLLCLAELYYEHWDISKTTEEIFLHDPFVLSSKDDIVHLKNKPHPLRWLYDLIKTEQLFLYYSSKQCTLTLVYSLILSRTKKQTFNVFTFYAYCKENSTTNSFFKHLFEFDNYQSILQMNTTTTTNNNNNTTAMNIIDFIYQEIQATTMLNIDDNNSLVLSKSLLKDDVIQLKVHQIKSSKVKKQAFSPMNKLYLSFFCQLIGC